MRHLVVLLLAVTAVAALAAAGGAAATVTSARPSPSELATTEVPTTLRAPELPEELSAVRLGHPDRTIVEDADGGWVATFTDGAHTVALAGTERRFDEVTATHGVSTDVWVRLLPDPFEGPIPVAWLERALASEDDDVLAVADQYLPGAPDVVDDDGVLVAGEAAYGPLRADGTRPVGSDWHDFRGVDHRYPTRLDRADPARYASLDCSGYIRTVFGARLGLPLSLRPDGGTSLPRRSFEQAADAPGIVPIDDRVVDAAALQTGDLVFFDSPDDDDGRIDHVGIYLGVDDAGSHRFLHSRRSTNGPTLGGDDLGPSILDGDGYFAEGFVSSRRL
jgi:hypothetical protein